MTSTQPDGLTRDRLRFDQPSEVDVYEALRRVQEALDTHDTVGVAAGVPFRVRGHTFRIDLLVTFKGRVGIIEVDGASHYGRWVSDRSRDCLIEDAGAWCVYHIDAEDTGDIELLDDHIRRFLTRMTRQ
jgi:hypothetical protein